jgi:hypothetical protein
LHSQGFLSLPLRSEFQGRSMEISAL